MARLRRGPSGYFLASQWLDGSINVNAAQIVTVATVRSVLATLTVAGDPQEANPRIIVTGQCAFLPDGVSTVTLDIRSGAVLIRAVNLSWSASANNGGQMSIAAEIAPGVGGAASVITLGLTTSAATTATVEAGDASLRCDIIERPIPSPIVQTV